MAAGERFALQRAKAFDLKFPRGQGAPTCTVRCDVRGCTETAETHTKPEMPPLVIAKRFRRLGWEVDNEGMSATCPTHVRGKRKPDKIAPIPALERLPSITTIERLPPIPPLPSTAEVAETMRAALSLVPDPLPTFPHEDEMPEQKPPTTTPNEFPHEMAEAAQRALSKPPTVDARKAQFAANRLLDEHYSDELRRYEAGWSDARIATETGAAEAWVAETREAVYGPMGDPEVEALESQLGDVCTHYRQEIEGLRDLIVKAEQGFAAKLEDVRNRLHALQQKRANR